MKTLPQTLDWPLGDCHLQGLLVAANLGIVALPETVEAPSLPHAQSTRYQPGVRPTAGGDKLMSSSVLMRWEPRVAQVMALVEGALIERFGPYAGWAHNTLFIAELSSHKVWFLSAACFVPCRERYNRQVTDH